jgi:hypothetical protein
VGSAGPTTRSFVIDREAASDRGITDPYGGRPSRTPSRGYRQGVTSGASRKFLCASRTHGTHPAALPALARQTRYGVAPAPCAARTLSTPTDQQLPRHTTRATPPLSSHIAPGPGRARRVGRHPVRRCRHHGAGARPWARRAHAGQWARRQPDPRPAHPSWCSDHGAAGSCRRSGPPQAAQEHLLQGTRSRRRRSPRSSARGRLRGLADGQHRRRRAGIGR